MPGESEASTISERRIKRDASEKEGDVRKQKTRSQKQSEAIAEFGSDSIRVSESYTSFLERKPNATEEERTAFFDARIPDCKFYQPQYKRRTIGRTIGGRFIFIK